MLLSKSFNMTKQTCRVRSSFGAEQCLRIQLKRFDQKIFRNSRRKYLAHKDSALKFIEAKIEHFNQSYNFKFNKINIRNQKTRWGSCSKKGNLNFSYRLLFLPQCAADYIIVHELCHLKEPNHSYKFWNLVAKTIPNYLEIRKELACF